MHPILPNSLAAVLVAALLLPLVEPAPAQTVQSTAITDKLHNGAGVIDLLKNVSGGNLNKYFNETGKLLLLGVDVNEDSSGNESGKSLGVAIKNAQLAITTTDGNFTFKDFFTGTTSYLREAGVASTANFHTMFGQGGSSQIAGTGSLDISKFDDVMWFENVDFTGSVTGAKLTVNLLNTGSDHKTSTGSEAFFDFSGGFEDFALFNVADSILLEQANIGVAGAPSDIVFSASGTTAISAIAKASASSSGGSPSANGSGGTVAGVTGGDMPGTPAAPAPPLAFIALFGIIWMWRGLAWARLGVFPCGA